MPLVPTWPDILIRLLCALIAGAALGLNRSRHGRAAGLRTSILVSLAASIAMIEVNLLLTLHGRPSDSFVMNDLMRLPLGILSGMGFIGAGAIVRRDNLITGVTTAATMWFITTVGLCFGAGYILLGSVGTAIALAALVIGKAIEERMAEDLEAKLSMNLNSDGPSDQELHTMIMSKQFHIISSNLKAFSDREERTLEFNLRWKARRDQTDVPDWVLHLAQQNGVLFLDWTSQAR